MTITTERPRSNARSHGGGHRGNGRGGYRPGGGRGGRSPGDAGPLRHTLRALSTAMTVLVSMLAVLLMVIAVASHLSSHNQVTAFGHPVLTVLSGSMSPVIKTGDLIIDDQVTSGEAGRLRPGQIASFLTAPGGTVIVTHRIVARKVVHGVVEYQTKGDANNAPDTGLRPATDVVGVFSASIRHGGYILAALHRPLVPILLAVSAALFFLAGPLFRLARDMDKRDASTTN
jgi:signal peptidase